MLVWGWVQPGLDWCPRQAQEGASELVAGLVQVWELLARGQGLVWGQGQSQAPLGE